jgi:hypothetical protein
MSQCNCPHYPQISDFSCVKEENRKPYPIGFEGQIYTLIQVYEKRMDGIGEHHSE